MHYTDHVTHLPTPKNKALASFFEEDLNLTRTLFCFYDEDVIRLADAPAKIKILSTLRVPGSEVYEDRRRL